MSCPHCCYDCKKEGEDMSVETFRNALALCEDYDSIPFIGGGEPTLHPSFELMLLEGMSSAAVNQEKLSIITNGSMTRRALMLASLARADMIHAHLSRDEYHDEIDEEVVEAFGEQKGFAHSHGVWDTSNEGRRDPLPHGRALVLLGYDEDEGLELTDSDCMCSQWTCKPDGTIYQCGCSDAPQIGDVQGGICSPMSYDCWRSSSFLDECEDNEDYAHLLP
jgi:hypothetical protein